jgi:hypothetical protein
MGLENALVDRARVLKQLPAATGQVRGMTRTAWVEGAWFGAFLQLPQAGASTGPDQGRRRVVRSPTVMFDVLDEENEPVVVNVSVRLEIDSERFGRTVWQPTGDPEPLASLDEVLGYQVTVRQITDHEITPLERM